MGEDTLKIHVYSPNRIEPWDYRNVFDVGIGGSETSHVEMAIRLAARGHEVVSYTDLPGEKVREAWRGVEWKDLADADLTADGLWIVYRRPSVGKVFVPTPTRLAWLVCQDVFYPDWQAADVAAFDRVIGLCPRHVADIQGRDPAAKVCLSSNAVNVERALRQPAVERNPARLVWTSSPDRGLKELLDIYERAKEQVEALELHVFYGLDNIEKISGGDRTKAPWRDSWRQYDRALALPGVTWRGRIGQDALAQELLAAGIWCYPTWFPETSCISCMEAQVYGCIPITNPIWATGWNVKHGVFVEGPPSDRLVMSRYVDAVVRIASNPEGQERLRGPMMAEARQRCSWEWVADQWHGWATADMAIEEATLARA